MNGEIYLWALGAGIFLVLCLSIAGYVFGFIRFGLPTVFARIARKLKMPKREKDEFLARKLIEILRENDELTNELIDVLRMGKEGLKHGRESTG